MSFLIQRYFKRARANADNAEFFQTVAPATWRDFLPSILSAGFAVLAGIIVLTLPVPSWLPILIILPVVAGLIYFIFDQNRFWVISVPKAPASPNTSESDTDGT